MDEQLRDNLKRDIDVFLAQLPAGAKERTTFFQFLAGRPERTAYDSFVEGVRLLYRDAWLNRVAAAHRAEEARAAGVELASNAMAAPDAAA